MGINRKCKPWVGVVSTLLLVSVWSNAAAGLWTKSASRASGSLTMVQLEHTFTPIQTGGLLGLSSGTGGTGFVSASFGVGSIVYIDLTNSSALSVDLTGSVTATLSLGLAVFPSVTVSKCTSTWNVTFGTCGGSTVVLPTVSSGAGTPFTWGTFTSGQTLHYKIVTAGTVGTVLVNASASEVMPRSGIDRTAG